jgi:aquaporin Z
MKNWREYLIEGWALGMFMVSALFFTILLEHPASPLRQNLASGFVRRFLGGLAMGLTAVCLIYSPWGKRSGAHMNPAVTLSNWLLNRITARDAAWYMIAQATGGAMAVALFSLLAPAYVVHPAVHFAATTPGAAGTTVAFLCEVAMSFIMITTVLTVNNTRRYAPYTGYFAGILVMLFITFEAPFSGMSLNPARTLASALSSGIWTGWWIYCTAPLIGMLGGAWLFRYRYMLQHDGDCATIRFHQSGERHNCKTYEILYDPKNVVTAQHTQHPPHAHPPQHPSIK